MYGAPAQHGYAAPPPPQYGAQQPHYGAPAAMPPHMAAPDPNLAIGTDPNAFANMYNSHLKSLTFNSKPIITNLTVIAHDHAATMSAVVAKCLDDHIMHSHPSVRLPALYTLDSISKNIGHPYTQLWAARIVPIFLESYRLVDQPTKMRMEELLATWKTAGPGARPLFGDNAQWSIERALFGSQGMPQHSAAHAAHAAPVADPRASTAKSKAKAIENIDRLLAIDGQALAANPADQSLHERVDSLAQLKQVILTADLSNQEMAQIHAQLDSLSAASQQSNSSGHAATMQAQPPGPSLPQGLSGALASLSSLAPPAAAAPAANGGQAPPNAASSLIASLMQAGLLPGSSTPSTAAATPPPVERDQDEDYVNAILSLDIKISGAEFNREPACWYDLILHKHLAQQCRQCANRYPAGAKAQARMDDHLDWHFTQNRRAKDSAARGQSRSWFDRLDAFIRGGFDDSARTTRSGAGDDGEGKTTLSAAQDKALKEKFAKTFVVVPSDADVAARPCGICKEPFKSQWSEDEEEWIWLNAIRVDDNGAEIYYHASCHHSAKSLTDSVADRRTASVGVKRRSTSRTATPTASTAAARKRKSDLEPALDIVEEPPAKKSAI
ncbi:pre-mRNA cleavage factor cfi subunit [Moesziomyces antarcticus]|uniref:Related to PCF11 component of pre-mRNA 3`-end processing factor CF I n=2 Tax=Pseudozyma antarctica TaxID=84753 RepID=A0A5C3FRV4_PSEA2|nr:pre-mRNA cleavage factor cfi subunit [Moesziomyces antarcticus]GAK67988.1 pre-mRNA cleavage factor cfi subunit [Moesziomyces antarcticus]SPO47164.1 related to PCF11 component of pre-mRNA 3`-end processing factor CF I [Moesziomyces antarcticus]